MHGSFRRSGSPGFAFHFHAPSEHTVDVAHAPYEFHFVHRSGDGRLAVLGVLVREGKEHEAFAGWLDELPYEAGATHATNDSHGARGC